MLLHTDPFTHRPFYTQTLLHTEAFTHRSFYTQRLLHTEAFTHRGFYTQTLLHTDAFTYRPFYTHTLFVKNVNPSTPLVYPNQRFRKITTPDTNTYCVCISAVTYFSAMSSEGTCSTPTPKCTSDSFFSLQTPHTTEQVNKNQGRHTATAHKQRKEARSSSVATVSSALGDTAVQFSSEHLTPLP